uniref:G_PROTEIN_RECEP_F1_2 domain-containing protein n=1 Tax=Meloidogyne floridensis TaxID=298350 RepID=A0A915P4A7_9BILA
MDESPFTIIGTSTTTTTITPLKLFTSNNNPSVNISNENNLNNLTKNSIFMEEPPVEAWCFDLLLFYRSLGDDDPQAKKMLAELEAYERFSFVVNGLITCLLVSFGLIGNALFVYQLHNKSNHFSRRLAKHLTALCIWDIALLCCCLCSYGIICMCLGILPFVGVTAYLLYLFQPFAILAITIERHKAVSRPLEQRTRKGQFSLRSIFSCIVFGAFALNFLAVPFERALIDCYEFRSNGFEVRTMIVQRELVNNQYYAILSHLIPDLIFRAPTPIVIIAILTVRTLQIASAQRTVGHQQIIPQRQRALGRNFENYLFALGISYLNLVLTLYLFNTILMEVMGYGGKTSSQQTELEMEQYISSLYLTDFSNMLLAIHSATNCLTLSASSRADWLRGSAPIDSTSAEQALNKFRELKNEICADILSSLCNTCSSIGNALGIDKLQNRPITPQLFLNNTELLQHTNLLGNIIESVLIPLARPNSEENDIIEWRDFCRQIGYQYAQINGCLNAEQWKIVRWKLVLALSGNRTRSIQIDERLLINNGSINNSLLKNNKENNTIGQKKRKIWHQFSSPSENKNNKTTLTTTPTTPSSITPNNHQKALVRTFNCTLREMKNGALCAFVDSSQRQMTSRNGYKNIGKYGERQKRDSSASQQQYGIAPIHLIKRLNWINGPPAGVVARAIFPRPSTSQDSFSLVLPTNEKQYLRDEENIENYENEENKRRFSREIVD